VRRVSLSTLAGREGIKEISYFVGVPMGRGGGGGEEERGFAAREQEGLFDEEEGRIIGLCVWFWWWGGGGGGWGNEEERKSEKILILDARFPTFQKRKRKEATPPHPTRARLLSELCPREAVRVRDGEGRTRKKKRGGKRKGGKEESSWLGSVSRNNHAVSFLSSSYFCLRQERREGKEGREGKESIHYEQLKGGRIDDSPPFHHVLIPVGPTEKEEKCERR